MIVCFGELLIRLTAAGRELLMQSPSLALHVGGAEANVAVGLANLGHATAMVSAVPDNALGRGAVAAVRGQGVDCAGVQVCDGRMGLYFLSVGAGLRASEIVYDRAGSSFAGAPADAFDWDALLGGAGLLHLSGITPALGPKSAEASVDGPTLRLSTRGMRRLTSSSAVAWPTGTATEIAMQRSPAEP